jgi:hypothetical protein
MVGLDGVLRDVLRILIAHRNVLRILIVRWRHI